MKPKVGVFSFSGCEGCQLQILECEDELLGLLDHIELVVFREAMDKISDNYAIAFIDGGITHPSELPRLRQIRAQADILVALGTCASLGGINALKNRFSTEDVMATVYGDHAHYFETLPEARPVDTVVPVDYYVYGCPAIRTEILAVTQALLMGLEPRIPTYPVCMECKRKENVCLFHLGKTCAGPIVRAGCDALCPSYGAPCVGCRGLVPEPNLNAHRETLEEAGIEASAVAKEFDIFCSWQLAQLDSPGLEASHGSAD